MKRFATVASAILALGMLFAAACGDDGGGGDGSSETPSAQTPAGEPTEGEPSVSLTPEIPFSEACQKSEEKQWSASPPLIIDSAKTYVATIKTAKGDMVVELDNGPVITTNNFVFLACKGYYDGLTFHRVEPEFVIQGGDPTGTGSGGPGYSIPGEFEGAVFDTGVIGMARTNDPNSAGSQFFIMLGRAENLDGAYAAFGRLTSGQDVAGQIAVGDVMETITIEEQ
jgi:cyclophilin family peptidyl-prolyl cis-trans isomerase